MLSQWYKCCGIFRAGAGEGSQWNSGFMCVYALCVCFGSSDVNNIVAVEPLGGRFEYARVNINNVSFDTKFMDGNNDAINS